MLAINSKTLHFTDVMGQSLESTLDMNKSDELLGCPWKLVKGKLVYNLFTELTTYL